VGREKNKKQKKHIGCSKSNNEISVAYCNNNDIFEGNIVLEGRPLQSLLILPQKVPLLLLSDKIYVKTRSDLHRAMYFYKRPQI